MFSKKFLPAAGLIFLISTQLFAAGAPYRAAASYEDTVRIVLLVNEPHGHCLGNSSRVCEAIN